MQKINWSLEALNDFEDYVDWYLKYADEVVAMRFMDSIESALKYISLNQHASRMVGEIPELREYIVYDFPFLISYWIKNQDEIIITSFLHQKMKK
ncbi:type II toxin-antitoxin system RelE/ParE family toxin [Cysteiniphilum sp. 6C5]|uniref:type II toxin-antitoxin system RelE/ParE family toxin n=1 Tax=unclassified Cysteiniphilum TaxID=2610889 RepID=UPI003F859511